MGEEGGIELITRWFMQKWAERDSTIREKERLKPGNRIIPASLDIPKKQIIKSQPKFGNNTFGRASLIPKEGNMPQVVRRGYRHLVID